MSKRVLVVTPDDPRDLAGLLAARLGLSPDQAAEWVARGAVSVDGRPSPPAAIAPGCRIVVRPPREAPVEDLAIVHHDDWLLAVIKPAGLLAQATSAERDAVDTRAAALLGPLRPHLLHRLDRDTSGLVLLTLRPDAHAAMQHGLADGAIERAYLAVVAGRLGAPRDVRLRVAADGKDQRRRQALPESATGGQAAWTRVDPLASDGERSWLKATLRTGRTHQIRVHLAAIGHPVVGDRLYDGPPAPRLLLHAWTLSLLHPGTGRRLDLVAPPPAELLPPAALTGAPA